MFAEGKSANTLMKGSFKNLCYKMKAAVNGGFMFTNKYSNSNLFYHSFSKDP